jgi:hypothetical protein
MPRSLFAVIAALASLALPSAAHANWSAPVTLSRTSVWPAAVAADSAGDSAVAWATVRALPPKSMDRYCALHPFKRSCYGISSVHLAVRTSRGRVVTRKVWEGRSGEMGMSLVIAHGEATLGWGAYDVGDPNETAREVHGPLLGPWSRARVLGHFLDYLITGGHTPFYPRLAGAPNGTILAAWSACGSLKRCPGSVPGVTLAWRAPRHGFGRPDKLAAAPEGAVPSFDSAGETYLHSSCSARVLLASPGNHTFRRVVTLTSGPVRDLSLGLSGAGEGLVSWIPTACSTDEAAGPIPGSVLASVLDGGVFAAPAELTPVGVTADYSESVAVPGGGVIGWLARDKFNVPFGASASLGSAPALPEGATPIAADGGGDVVFGGPRAVLSSLQIAVMPVGSTVAEPSSALVAVVGTAAFGRAVAVGWSEGTGPLRLSVWRH